LIVRKNEKMEERVKRLERSVKLVAENLRILSEDLASRVLVQESTLEQLLRQKNN
jgi:hypothetical protein